MEVWNPKHWKFSKLSFDQPKIRLLDVKEALYESYANHKTKTYSRYTKDREKGIKAYHYEKQIHKRRQKEKKKKTREKQSSQKTIKWH